MKSVIATLLLFPFVSLGAIQATREYCDKNAEKAVSRSLSQISDYLTEHNIPTVKTNHYYEITHVTNNFYDVTNTFVTTLLEETNTQFIVWGDDLLTIEKDGKQIWHEKDVNDINETAMKTYMDTKINPVLDNVGEFLSSAESELDTYSTTIDDFIYGSNRVFQIWNTAYNNYDPTRVDTLDDGTLDSMLTIKTIDKKTGAYTERYSSRKDIMSYINYYGATNTIRSDVMTEVSNKADKAWGKYTSAGGEAPSNTVYMTAPNTVFAGGMEYQRVAVGEGSICVLVTKGAQIWTQGDEGVFKFQDDGGTNYFGFAKTDSYVVGCDTDGISVADNIVTLKYNVTMSGVPSIWYTPSIDTQPIQWEQLSLTDGTAVDGASHVVSWEQNPDAGTEVCYINCSEARGFFRATIEVAGSAKFVTNMPADLSGGIIATNETLNTISIIRPVVRNGIIVWEEVR